MNFLDHIWMIPLFPLLGALLMLLVGQAFSLLPGFSPARRAEPPRFLVSLLCPGMVLLSFLLSCGAVWQLSQLPGRIHQVIQFTWVAGLPFHMANGALATFHADWGFLLDPLSSVMILVVTGVGFLIHVYSVGYMAHDGGYYRFFGYLNLFVFFMLMLVLANNYALLFVGWEGVGLCSYLLISFYFHKKSAGDAGKKAFVVNRVGDAGFILGMLLLLSVLGTLRFTDVNALLRTGSFSPGALTAIAVLLFIGATGKSAQFPLYVWLPDAMEGPTPVSALIHAATMVTAGVYMVARSSALFHLTPTASTIVATVGAFTAIFAATIALVQTDIKRVLAYSTVSQLGYVFLALGVGAYWVAVFHLFTHAFFKALLFLCSGSVIHALGGEQDMRFMGALKKKIPITHWTMFVGSVAIAGIPGLAGFFSKDEILWQAYRSSHVLWFVGLTTAGMTAFYMWRLMNMTFYGKSRVPAEKEAHIHESPATMTIPLTLLAIGSVLAGWLGTPKLWNLGENFRAFERWLEPSFAIRAVESEHPASTEWILMGVSVAVAIFGIALARYFYVMRTEIPERIAARFRPIYTVLYHKWYVDEIYDFLFINGLGKGGGRMLGVFDRKVIDGGVNGAGWLTRFSSSTSMWWDKWIIDGAVRLGSFFVKTLSFPVCSLQSGRLQGYAFFIVIGVALFFGYYVTR
ncbi:MAG TPA: NADH-quinone oxidoreductase subunit L [Bryobacteraceae bacterium]|nr:NADH-quinone oxidoreductase subunit L [Bryobacteraceae bacterium]